MKNIARRLGALEDREHPQKIHMIRCHADDDERAAIDAYGRELIGRNDLTVVLRSFG